MPTRLTLIAEELSLERGGRRLIDGLSFRVAAGEAMLLTGPNGAGKTTLLRAIAGFVQPVAGTIALAGADAERTLAEQCHFVSHANAIRPTLTVVENTAFWTAYLGGEPGGISAALDRFGLADLAHIPAGYLSAGQKRRLGLVRLLVAPRAVWLLDEPSVSLDAASTAVLAEVVAAHVSAGGIAVAATHVPLGLENALELRLGRV